MEYSKVYGFTNENLTSYKNIYNFKNSRVLSVIGSGDQYLSSILFGAESVILFDKNEIARLYFLLKFYAIRYLSYEEFTDYFVNKKIMDKKYYSKIRRFLPKDVKYYFDKVYKNNIFIQYPISISNNPINFSTGRVIPYLEKENYYKLQTILRNIEIPIIKTSYLEELYFDKLGKFDVMLFSNIYLYLDMDYQKYKKFLIGLRNNLTTDGKIQANYTWTNGGRGYDDFIHSSDDGFDVTEVSSVRYDGKTDFKDYVLTYKK